MACHGKIGPDKTGPAGPILDAKTGPAGPNYVDLNWSGRTTFGHQNLSDLTKTGPDIACLVMFAQYLVYAYIAIYTYIIYFYLVID